MTMMFLGYRSDGARREPAQGPLENAEKFDCVPVAIYNDELCRGDIRVAEGYIRGEVRLRNDDPLYREDFLHNPHGFACFCLTQRMGRRNDTGEYFLFYLNGKKMDKIDGFELIDPAKLDVYKALGYKLYGDDKYIAVRE